MGTIAEEISALRGRIDVAYDHISAKGGTVPQTTDSWNLPVAIDSIPTGAEPEVVDGVYSLYAMLPELTYDTINSRWVLSGTHRAGPYTYNLSSLETISNAFQRPRVGDYASNFALYRVQSDSSRHYVKERMPNISCVDLSRLKSVTNNMGLQGFATGNFNLLSVNLDSLSAIQATYGIHRAFHSDLLPCDMPELVEVSGDYVCSEAWKSTDVMMNPLSAQLKFRGMPKLKSATGDYAFNQAWYQYMAQDKAFSLSALKSATGQYMFSEAFGGTELSSIEIGLSSFTSQYMFSYAFENMGANLKSITFPDLRNINASYGFQFAFQQARCGNMDNTFPVLSSIGNNNVTNYTYVFRYAWYNAFNLSSVTFPELTRIGTNCQYTFYRAVHSDMSGASSWPVLDLKFPKLTTFRQGAQATTPFRDMNGQDTAGSRRRWRLHLNALTTLTAGTSASQSTFYQNRGMTDIYFDKLSAITNNYVFSNCSELSGIHFGAANETAIKATTGWSTLWGRGAGAATVSFDL